MRPASVLAGDELLAALEPTLGETLAGEAGVHSTYFGPGASRPIIRGLGGDRIRVLDAGLGVGDVSTTSPDHAVALESMASERIEIVRGPQSALYGGGAIGGIVHVVTRHGGPLRARGVLEAGTHGTWRATAGVAGARGPWSWGGSIDRTMTDGSTADVPSVGSPVSNDDYRRAAGSGSIAWSDRAERRIREEIAHQRAR